MSIPYNYTVLVLYEVDKSGQSSVLIWVPGKYYELAVVYIVGTW